jgi:PAS domain S-box-containing protein
MSPTQLLTASSVILDSLNDGVYVCDRERRIVFWSRGAERITGWRSEDVVGRRCLDNVLCHIDKDGHRLCGEEFCPLHRSMVTGTASTVGLLVYGQVKTGHRIPMQVSVSPIRDDSGRVIGGVETFRDMSQVLDDLNRAKRIQALSLQTALPRDPRVSFSTHYVPHDIVGGDFYAVKQLGDDHYAFFLADVMGHGVAAALHTMQLSSIWERHGRLLGEPIGFVQAANAELERVVKGESFATGLFGVLDIERRTLRFVSAGGPPPMIFRASGMVETPDSTGFPLGMVEQAEFEETAVRFETGDALLCFTDGATEMQNSVGEQLGAQGLERLLRESGYPARPLDMTTIERELLKYSNDIRLHDDLTFLDVRFADARDMSRDATGNAAR